MNNIMVFPIYKNMEKNRENREKVFLSILDFLNKLKRNKNIGIALLDFKGLIAWT